MPVVLECAAQATSNIVAGPSAVHQAVVRAGGGTMSGSDVTQLAADFIDAFNRADWPRFQAMMAPEVVYQETGTLRRVQGHEQYV